MSRASLQSYRYFQRVFTCFNSPKLLPSALPAIPVRVPNVNRRLISLKSTYSDVIYLAPNLNIIEYIHVPQQRIFEIPGGLWVNIDPEIDIEKDDEHFIHNPMRIHKEISEPDTVNQGSIQCKMHQGRNVKRLRRIKMRRHRYVKWLKRMRFKLRKIRFERRKMKAKAFQDQLNEITKAAETFDAENFIKGQVELARKGGYQYDIRADLNIALVSNDPK